MKDILDGLPEIGSLSRDQEIELIDKSPEVLALHNMREGFFYAKKCCRAMLPDDEIYSAAYEALMKAANNFKPGQIRFFSYAKPYIRGALSTVWREKNVVKRANNYSISEISEYAADKEEHDAPFEKTNGLTGFLILQKNSKSVEPTCDPEIESIQLREEYELIKPLIQSELTDKEQTVIVLKYKSGLTFQKIGELLDTSRPDIQVTHSRALAKLRKAALKKIR